MNTSHFALKVRNAFAFGALALCLAAPAASAQTDVLSANVPFAFESGGQRFAPGLYRVKMFSANAIELQNPTTHADKLVMTNTEISLRPSTHGRLVFRRYGNRYFLRQVWSLSEGTGRSLVKTKAEKEVQIASAKQTEPDVTLALNQLPR